MLLSALDAPDIRLIRPGRSSSQIIAGQLLFVYDQRVFRISKRWLSEHPGGEQVMLNYVGREVSRLPSRLF